MEPIGDSIKQGQEQRSRNIRHLKQFFIGLIATSILVLDWWLLRTALFDGAPASFWVWPVLASAAWIAAISFFALLSPDRLTFFIFNAAGLAAYLALMPRDVYVFLGGVLFFLMSMWFQRRVQDEKKNQLNFSIRRTLWNSQMVATYAILLLIGFMIYSSVESEFERDPDAFYGNLGEAAVRSLPYVTQDQSRYNLSQNMGEFFRKQAENSFPQFNQVSAEQQRQLLNEIRADFQRQFGVEADEQESLRVAMTEVVTQRLRESLGPYERFFPLIFTIGVLALLRTFAFVFNWLTLLVTWLAYRLLLGLKFFRLEKQTVEVEKLDL